jgi:hypothetical protein
LGKTLCVRRKKIGQFDSTCSTGRNLVRRGGRERAGAGNEEERVKKAKERHLSDLQRRITRKRHFESEGEPFQAREEASLCEVETIELCSVDSACLIGLCVSSWHKDGPEIGCKSEQNEADEDELRAICCDDDCASAVE